MVWACRGYGGSSARVDRAWRPSWQRQMLQVLTSGEKRPAEGESLAGVLGDGKKL